MEDNFISLSSDEGEQESLKNTIATIVEISLDQDSSPEKEKDKSLSTGVSAPQELLLEKGDGEKGKGRLRSKLLRNVNAVQTSNNDQGAESVRGNSIKRKKSFDSSTSSPSGSTGGNSKKCLSSSQNNDIDKSYQDVASAENELAGSDNSQSPAKQVGFSIKEERISLSPPPQTCSPFNNEPPSPPQVESQEEFDVSQDKSKDPVFVPEGWFFYCHKRMLGIQAGKFDQYYVAPGGKKLRSRVDVARWLQSRKEDMDPADFFIKPHLVGKMVKQGLLKFIAPAVVVPATAAENTMDDLHATITSIGLSSQRKKKTQIIQKKTSEKAHNQRKDTAPLLKDKSPSDNEQESNNGSDEGTELPRRGFKTRSRSTRQAKDVQMNPPIKTQPRSKNKPEKPVRIKKTPIIKKSQYFSLNDGIPENPVSLRALRRERDGKDAPPRSPFNLIQEDLFHDPWQLLTATIFLNCTSGKMAVPLAMEFLTRWPTPQEACRANFYDMLDVVEQLGLGRTRVAILIRFSHEFLTKDWRYPKELYGIGKYGNDSYRIFCMRNEWKRVETDDPMLMMYLNWRRATEHLRKRFKNNPGDPNFIDPHELPVQSQRI